MELNDLFVSYKQVDPVLFHFDEPTLPQPIYLNAERAKQVTSEEPVEAEDMSTWSVNESDISTWKVKGSDIPQETAVTVSPESTPVVPVTTSSSGYSGSSNSLAVPRWTSVYRGKRKQWIEDMTAAYKRAGLSDNAIKNLIIKNAIESGWGHTAQGSYNFGNITPGKYWKGKYVNGRDTDGKGNPIKQKFRAYDSLDEYVADEIQFLTRLYDFDQNDNIATFAHKLQGGNRGKRFYAAKGGPYKEALINWYKQRYG